MTDAAGEPHAGQPATARRTFASTTRVSPCCGAFSEYSTSLTVPHGGPSASGSTT
jgi:hypothetical protein